MAIKEAECNITAQSGMSAIWTAIHGHTGREVRGNEGYVLATEWAKLEARAELLNHPACEEFRRLAPSAPRVSDTALVFFRGKGFNTDTPSAEQMGPGCREGRYNRSGECMLYLSDSEEGVLCELNAWHVEGIPYVMRYRLPLNKLNIADFTMIPDDHFMAAVFSKAEECNVGGRGSNSYIFSQLVADLVMAHFDGMRIPGVRGDRNFHYSNVVVSHPDPDWRNWLEQETTPYRLSVPS
jgi:hypothetical protein